MKRGGQASMKLAGGSLVLLGLMSALSAWIVVPLLLIGAGGLVLVVATFFVKAEQGAGRHASEARASGLAMGVFGFLVLCLAAMNLPSVRPGSGGSVFWVFVAGLGLGLTIVGIVRGVLRGFARLRQARENGRGERGN